MAEPSYLLTPLAQQSWSGRFSPTENNEVMACCEEGVLQVAALRDDSQGGNCMGCVMGGWRWSLVLSGLY